MTFSTIKSPLTEANELIPRNSKQVPYKGTQCLIRKYLNALIRTLRNIKARTRTITIKTKGTRSEEINKCVMIIEYSLIIVFVNI